MLGSLIGAVVFTGWEVATSPFPDPAPIENALLVGMVVMYMGAFIGIPVGLMVGLPLLATSGPIIQRHRLAMSLLFGLIGLAGGWMIGNSMGASESRAGMVFGFAIGALHALLYPAERRST